MSLTASILQLPPSLIKHWGYLFLFLIALGEATPLFGLFIPGQILVILGGFLAKNGVLDLGDLLFFVAAGAILGDTFGYILGRKYGTALIMRYGNIFYLKKEYFEKTKKLMEQHTVKTLIIGRFNSLTRAFAPFVAGATGLSFFKFLFSNIIGGIFWTIVFVFGGYLFGTSYEIASQYIGRFLFFALLAGILIIYAYKHVNKKKHIFTKRDILLLLCNFFSIFLFSKMLQDVLDKETTFYFDLWSQQKIAVLQHSLLTKMMVVITTLFSPTILILFSLLLCLYFWHKKQKTNAALLSIIMVGAMALTLLIKEIIQRARPENMLLLETGYSFPSGHATIAAVFFCFIIYLFYDKIENTLRRYLFAAANIFVILLIGFSRMYLQVHWFSDIIAGFCLGMFWFTIVILGLKIFTAPKTTTTP